MEDERKVYKVLVGKPEGRDHSEDRGVDERMRSELMIGWECVEWIELAQDRDWWRTLVNTTINLRVLALRSW
jgi:hypothetical protein